MSKLTKLLRKLRLMAPKPIQLPILIPVKKSKKIKSGLTETDTAQTPQDLCKVDEKPADALKDTVGTRVAG